MAAPELTHTPVYDERVLAVMRGEPPPYPASFRAADYSPPEHWEKPLHAANKLPGSERMQFLPGPHLYLWDGKPVGISVTGVVHRYFDHFDADRTIQRMINGRNWTSNTKYQKEDGTMMTAEEIKARWASSGELAAGMGTWIHWQAELILNGLPHCTVDPEVAQLGDLLANFMAPSRLAPFDTEVEICSPEDDVAGSIDALFRNQDTGAICIVDWKVSAKLVQLTEEVVSQIPYDNLDRARRWGGGGLHLAAGDVLPVASGRPSLPPIAHLKDCTIVHYFLQLNLYAHILRKVYGLNVDRLLIVVLHRESRHGWVVMEAPLWTGEAAAVFADHNRRRNPAPTPPAPPAPAPADPPAHGTKRPQPAGLGMFFQRKLNGSEHGSRISAPPARGPFA